MYLTKNSLSNFYTRIPLPKSLRDLGYPFSVRVSLETKSRKVAVVRNLKMASYLRDLIDTKASSVSSHTFQKWIHESATQFRTDSYLEIATPKLTDTAERCDQNAPQTQFSSGIRLSETVTFDNALARFLQSKKSEKIQQKSLDQLSLRISAFIKWAKKKKFTQVNQIELSLFVLVNTFIPPNNQDLASSRCSSFILNQAK